MQVKNAHEPVVAAAKENNHIYVNGATKSDEESPVTEDNQRESHSPPVEENTSPISKLFGVEQEQTSRCTKCGTENSKVSPVLLSSLMLQDLDGEHSFNQVLERSFDVSSITPAWCETCEKYQATQQRRRCLSLPPLLALSCANDTLPGFTFWSSQLQVVYPPLLVSLTCSMFYYYQKCNEFFHSKMTYQCKTSEIIK